MAAHPLHVERTADPTVLRWVCHLRHPMTTPLERGSPLGDLIDSGRLADVSADGGDLLVTVGVGGWSQHLIRETNDAVRAELEVHVQRHVDPRVETVGDSSTRSRPPTMTDVQSTIDRAVGAVASEHGGRIEVVELAGDVVVVDLHDACAGCPGAERTLVEVAERAVVTEFPGLSRVRARAGATRAVRFVRRS
jgi:NFU1 iron-sulfur cluster scaffold homolog, mitochondrial